MYPFVYIGSNQLLTHARNGFHYVYPADDMSIGLHLLLEGSHEPYVSYALGKILRPGDVVVDVGANIGYHSVAIAHCVGPNGHVHCFEPNKDITPLLHRNLTMNGFMDRCSIYELAVSDSTGERSMRMFHNDIGGSSIVGAPCPSNIKCVKTVGAVSLDFIQDHVDVLKIDAEGSEARILEGASTHINNGLRSIIIEHNPDYYTEALDDKVSALRSAGYVSYSLTQAECIKHESGALRCLPACDMLLTTEPLC